MNKAISQDLWTIFEILKAVQPHDGKTAIYERMAARLSQMVNKRPPWGWRYIQSIMGGTIQPSPELTRAVQLMTAAIDGTPPEFAEAKEITVMADPANVHAGSLVLGQSKQCEYDACPILFVPTVPWGKYCPAHRDPKDRRIQ